MYLIYPRDGAGREVSVFLSQTRDTEPQQEHNMLYSPEMSPRSQLVLLETAFKSILTLTSGTASSVLRISLNPSILIC